MFSTRKKRFKKSFPPGTFIPTPARVAAIFQLCLAFCVLLWNLCQPFMGEIFSIKSNMILFEDVMGIEKDSKQPERMHYNQQRFETIPKQEKETIISELQLLQKQLQRSFFQKIERGLSILFQQMPLFEQIWLMLSLIIPILLLKRVENSSKLVWLLPLLTSCYAVDNRLFAPVKSKSSDALFFPSEQELVQTYYKKPLPQDIRQQHEELKKVWNMYLVDKWAPNMSRHSIEKRQMEGEFQFNLNRLMHQLKQHSHKIDSFNHQYQEPIFLLALYFFWNMFFAYTVFRVKPEIIYSV